MINFINMIASLLTLLVLVYVISTWIFPPFNPFRAALTLLVDPMLRPIRRLIPPAGMFDFSAFILMILIQILQAILVALLR
jgi:YggT family protein